MLIAFPNYHRSGDRMHRYAATSIAASHASMEFDIQSESSSQFIAHRNKATNAPKSYLVRPAMQPCCLKASDPAIQCSVQSSDRFWRGSEVAGFPKGSITISYCSCEDTQLQDETLRHFLSAYNDSNYTRKTDIPL